MLWHWRLGYRNDILELFANLTLKRKMQEYQKWQNTKIWNIRKHSKNVYEKQQKYEKTGWPRFSWKTAKNGSNSNGYNATWYNIKYLVCSKHCIINKKIMKKKLNKLEAIQRWLAICHVWPWTLTYQKFLLCISSRGQDLYSYQKLNMYIYWFLSESSYRRRLRRRWQRWMPQYKY